MVSRLDSKGAKECFFQRMHVNLVDLVKSFPTNIFLQNLASIQKRTSPTKFDHLAEKSDKDSTGSRIFQLRPARLDGRRGPPEDDGVQEPGAVPESGRRQAERSC